MRGRLLRGRCQLPHYFRLRVPMASSHLLLVDLYAHLVVNPSATRQPRCNLWIPAADGRWRCWCLAKCDEVLTWVRLLTGCDVRSDVHSTFRRWRTTYNVGATPNKNWLIRHNCISGACRLVSEESRVDGINRKTRGFWEKNSSISVILQGIRIIKYPPRLSNIFQPTLVVGHFSRWAVVFSLRSLQPMVTFFSNYSFVRAGFIRFSFPRGAIVSIETRVVTLSLPTAPSGRRLASVMAMPKPVIQFSSLSVASLLSCGCGIHPSRRILLQTMSRRHSTAGMLLRHCNSWRYCERDAYGSVQSTVTGVRSCASVAAAAAAPAAMAAAMQWYKFPDATASPGWGCTTVARRLSKWWAQRRGANPMASRE